MKKTRLYRGLGSIFLAVAVLFSVAASVATAWSGKVDELGLPAVLTIENAHARIAETIVDSIEELRQKLL